MTVIWISQSNKSPVWQSNFQGYVALGLFELSFPLLLFYLFLSFFFVFWRILQGLWLCQICDMIEKGTDHQWDKVMSSCFLFIYFCIQGFISLKLWATISHAFALVKCENLFLVQTGVTSLLIAKRDTLKVQREKDLSLLGVVLMLPLNFDLVDCNCGRDAEEFDQRNSPVITVI